MSTRFPSLARRQFLPAILAVAAACAPDGPTAPSDRPGPGQAQPAPAASLACSDWDAPDSRYASWTPVFSDEFTAAGDLSRWTIWTGGAWNEELQHYQAANLDVSGGWLTIRAKEQTVTGATSPFDATPKTFYYTSGRIESGQSFSASKKTPRVWMAARLRLPAGSGMWPAFWSYGDPWPTQGEIDIMEARGQEEGRYYTAYWFGRRPGTNLVRDSEATILPGLSLSACWHVYEVIWEKDRLTYYFDGEQVDQKTGVYISGMFGKSQRVTLNLAVGGLFFRDYVPLDIQPDIFEVDWVRVFTAR